MARGQRPWASATRTYENLALRLAERLGPSRAEQEISSGARLSITQALQLAEDIVFVVAPD